jgi:5-methyltetrahydropteroyltriglutamate--homocysteine methyltransferase
VLQIDSPDLGIERAGYFQDEPLPKFIAAMEMHVAALNEALAGIPTERVRFHACWGNRDSPHVNDVPAPDVLPVCYQVKAGVRGRGVGQARGDARRRGNRQQAALELRRQLRLSPR